MSNDDTVVARVKALLHLPPRVHGYALCTLCGTPTIMAFLHDGDFGRDCFRSFRGPDERAKYYAGNATTFW